MDKNHSRGHEKPVDASAGHEISDARFKPIVVFLLGLTALVIFAFGSMVWMFDYLEDQARAVDRQPSPLADPQALPPDPRLQVRPAVELEKQLEQAGRQLQSYEWIDRESGVVRIPIERAMELLAERATAASSANSAEAGRAPGGRQK